jgi:hypothetical protein
LIAIGNALNIAKLGPKARKIISGCTTSGEAVQHAFNWFDHLGVSPTVHPLNDHIWWIMSLAGSYQLIMIARGQLDASTFSLFLFLFRAFPSYALPSCPTPWVCEISPF